MHLLVQSEDMLGYSWVTVCCKFQLQSCFLQKRLENGCKKEKRKEKRLEKGTQERKYQKNMVLTHQFVYRLKKRTNFSFCFVEIEIDKLHTDTVEQKITQAIDSMMEAMIQQISMIN